MTPAEAFPGCPPVPCTGCGQELSWRAAPDDTWVWADARGRAMVGGVEGEQITGYPNPWTVLKDISDRILAASTGPKSKRGPMPAHDEVCLYSDLLARVQLGHEWRHIHRHDRGCPHDGRHDLLVLEHCGWPMRLRPSGWHCRQRCGALTPHPT